MADDQKAASPAPAPTTGGASASQPSPPELAATPAPPHDGPLEVDSEVL